MLFRYAPTPSGFLHLGNGINFVLTYLLARSMGAPILLRIDDLDSDRKRPEYVADVFQTLDYLNLSYEQGPSGPDDFEQHWSQRHRLEIYETMLDRLVATGRVYAGGLSRQQLRAIANQPKAERLAMMRSQSVPLSTPEVPWWIQAPDDASFTDFVIRRRDGIPAYQIASLADDLHFGVTHVVRGDDLRESTDMQRYLAQLISEEPFERVCVWHHPVVTDERGQKLSKSAGSTSLRAIRETSEPPAVVYRMVAQLAGLPVEAGASLRALEGVFEAAYIASMIS